MHACIHTDRQSASSQPKEQKGEAAEQQPKQRAKKKKKNNNNKIVVPITVQNHNLNSNDHQYNINLFY